MRITAGICSSDLSSVALGHAAGVPIARPHPAQACRPTGGRVARSGRRRERGVLPPLTQGRRLRARRRGWRCWRPLRGVAAATGAAAVAADIWSGRLGRRRRERRPPPRPPPLLGAQRRRGYGWGAPMAVLPAIGRLATRGPPQGGGSGGRGVGQPRACRWRLRCPWRRENRWHWWPRRPRSCGHPTAARPRVPVAGVSGGRGPLDGWTAAPRGGAKRCGDGGGSAGRPSMRPCTRRGRRGGGRAPRGRGATEQRGRSRSRCLARLAVRAQSTAAAA